MRVQVAFFPKLPRSEEGRQFQSGYIGFFSMK